jgi:predicted DNA-binding transcriptional regulator AlpA
MKLLTPEEVATKLGLTKLSLKGLRLREKSFPAPVKLSTKVFRWDEVDIENWLETRKENTDG